VIVIRQPSDQKAEIFMKARHPGLTSDVARILSLVASRPNRRDTRRQDDLQGQYDFWFDGGACRVVTGGTIYDFADGTKVVVGGPEPSRYSLMITFADGYRVEARQTQP
jgi:hypothetical protein